MSIEHGDQLTLTQVSLLHREGSDGREYRRATQRGESRRVRRGIYVAEDSWRDATADERYLARIRSVVATRRRAAVCSHYSAAALWGLPVLGQWPRHVDLLADGRPGVRSKNGVSWHHESAGGDVVERCGLMCTSLERTLLDLAKDAEFPSAVAFLDYGTRGRIATRDGSTSQGVRREGLVERLAREGRRPGCRRALAAIRFCDPLAGSPGESLSRVQIHRLGFPAPRLQSRIERPDGAGADFPDFEWDDVFGEFDGRSKYTRSEFTAGRPMADIVWDEKRREDRLRSTGKMVARWVWDDVVKPDRLRAILLQAGLRPGPQGT